MIKQKNKKTRERKGISVPTDHNSNHNSIRNIHNKLEILNQGQCEKNNKLIKNQINSKFMTS